MSALRSVFLGAFNEERNWPEPVHIATDGETYGDHHRHGEMARTYALDYIRAKELADITNYGEYLAQHPPTNEVEIFENSSPNVWPEVRRNLLEERQKSAPNGDEAARARVQHFISLGGKLQVRVADRVSAVSQRN